ncbi:hypothetical protein IJ750_05445 [bacterium]|nr:hypothetical protein [bacterium]
MQSISNVTFTSRNRTIRKADDIARMVAQKFPLVSSTKYCASSKYMNIKDSLTELTRKIRSARWKYAIASTSLKYHGAEKINQYLDLIKFFNLGNCAEMTDLSMIVARLLGIKDTKPVELRTAIDEDLDHMALLVENSGKPYIIDAWLGFADYVPNANSKYKTVYRNFIHLDEYKSDTVKFKDYKINTLKTALDEMSFTDTQKVRQKVLK